MGPSVLPYLIDWLSLLGRWLHFIVGIAWIGSSLYFVWLDNHLAPPRSKADEDKGASGEVWSVHGGGFYHAQKYLNAPRQLPETLHWFKWEAYTTWMSGMFLLALVYWYGAEIYLIDASVWAASPLQAVVVAAAFLVGSWFAYDLLCKSPLSRSDAALAAGLLVLVSVLAWALCQVFSGRGAYIHFGAALGTIMVGNVFRVIIPSQKQMVAAAERGEIPDPSYGQQGKQRSVHNTYFTLPVLFVMISNHYAMTYSGNYNWLVLIALSVAGALIRVYFVARHKGRASLWPLALAILLLATVSAALAPSSAKIAQSTVSGEQIVQIVHSRCTTCHAEAPTFAAYATPPAGVLLETIAQIEAAAPRVHEQTVVSKVMPIGNLTGITDDERAQIDAWYQGLAAKSETDQ